MSSNESSIYYDHRADQITYEMLFDEWLQNFINSSNISLSNEALRDKFNELIEMINPENDPKFYSKKLMKNVIVIVCYSLIILVSLFGNLLVCYIILSKHRLRSRTTNILIANLTISDLLMTIVNVPLTTARLLLDDWPFGTVLCKLGPFIQATSVYVSTFSMTIIAIDRYQVLVGLLGKRFTTSVPTGLIILSIWLCSGLLSIPHASFNQIVELFTFKKLIRCRAVYPNPSDKYRQWITVLTFSTQYLIPLLITTICYTRIGIHIWKRVRIGAMTEEQISYHIQSKRRTIKMLIIVCVVFALCWLPLNIYHIRADFGLGNYSSTIFLICHWFAMSSVCYNPFIYFWLNKHYNERARAIFNVCLSMKCIHKSVSSDIQVVKDSNKARNGRQIHINHRLKRTNAVKVSRGRIDKRFLGAICIRGSISTTSSSHGNNDIIDNNGSTDNNGPNANQTTATGLNEETKL